MISPMKTKLWEIAIAIVISARDLRHQISYWRCSWNWGSHSSSWLLLVMTLYLLTLALEGQEGRLIFSNKDWQWMDSRLKDCQSLQSLTLYGLLIEYSGICFHLRSCTEENGSHQRKVTFRTFCCCFVFFEGRLLEAYFLECVWMVMVQLRYLYHGLDWHVRSTWSLK